MFSPFHRSKLFLIKNIIAHSIVSPLPSVVVHSKHLLPFAFSSLTAVSSRHLKSSTKSRNQRSSFAVSYLIDSCGLSSEIAEYVSKKVKFETPERPDSVLKLLKNHGFNEIQISRMVKIRPRLLLSDPEKTILPKIEFFRSIGVSKTDLASILSFIPHLMTRSLEYEIIPFYKLLKTVLHSDKKVVTVMKTSRIFGLKHLVRNITVLREHKVPESSITLLLNHFPWAMLQKPDQFQEAVDKVKEIGFDPLRSDFVLAIRAVSGKGRKLIWDRCVEAYKNWGWSEDDILLAFKKHPHCMILSEEKIETTMDFFVNKFGCQSKAIARMPTVLLYSLEKRIIPRCSVIQVLLLKGLKEKISLNSILPPAEKYFLQRFVTRYESQLPELMSIYQGKMAIFPL